MVMLSVTVGSCFLRFCSGVMGAGVVEGGEGEGAMCGVMEMAVVAGWLFVSEGMGRGELGEISIFSGWLILGSWVGGEWGQGGMEGRDKKLSQLKERKKRESLMR